MKTLIISALLFISTTVYAQDGYIELLRSDVRTKKIAIVTEVMQFDEAQSEVFWPIYKEYDHAMSKINDLRIAMIKSYAENFETMTDEKAAELVRQSFDFQEQRMKLKKTYFKKFEKVLPATTAAKFLQLDNQINLLIDIQIAAELPLIERMEEETDKATN